MIISALFGKNVHSQYELLGRKLQYHFFPFYDSMTDFIGGISTIVLD